jgi:hypothetical protein
MKGVILFIFLFQFIANIHAQPSQTKSLSKSGFYSSAILGLVADCDLKTGLTRNGNTINRSIGLANAAAINAILATASATKPVHLYIEAGIAIAAPIVIPDSGNVTIEGAGWSTGFYVLSGSNCNGIQNFTRSDLSTAKVWSPGKPTTITGSNIILSNFMLNGNRGVFPNGNSNGQRDETMNKNNSPHADFVTPSDVRGPYPGAGFWLSGIIFQNLDNIKIEHVWVYNVPAYHINLYHCTNVWVDQCRIEAGNPTLAGNTDGLHINGGCFNIFCTNSTIASVDDPVAINLIEGDGTSGGNIFVDNCVYENCITGGRVYNMGVTPVGSVSFTNISGTVQWWGLQIGNEQAIPAITQSIKRVFCHNWDIKVLHPLNGGAMFYITTHIDEMEISHCRHMQPEFNSPLVQIGVKDGAAPIISSLHVTDCGIFRTKRGYAPDFGIMPIGIVSFKGTVEN